MAVEKSCARLWAGDTGEGTLESKMDFMSWIMERSTSAGFVDQIGLPLLSCMNVPPRVKIPAVCAFTVFNRRLRFFPSG